MKTHRFMSRVRGKAGLLKLLLGLAFLFFVLFKQINIAVEGKAIGATFAPFFVSVILFSGWPKIFKEKSLSSHTLTSL